MTETGETGTGGRIERDDERGEATNRLGNRRATPAARFEQHDRLRETQGSRRNGAWRGSKGGEEKAATTGDASPATTGYKAELRAMADALRGDISMLAQQAEGTRLDAATAANLEALGFGDDAEERRPS